MNREDPFNDGYLWQVVPPEFRYLQPYVDKYGLYGKTIRPFGPNFEDSASSQEIMELSTAYADMIDRGNGKAIVEWCMNALPGTVKNEVAFAILGLFHLFDRLATAGITPFACGVSVLVGSIKNANDWSKVPAEFSELVALLAPYESLVTEDQVNGFVSKQSITSLKQLATILTNAGKYQHALNQWLNANSSVRYEPDVVNAVSGIQFLLYIMTDAVNERLGRNQREQDLLAEGG